MRGSTRASMPCSVAGALDEVAALAARKLDPLLPAMKAHGVPALIRHIRGELTREEAAAIGRTETRHYAKRQFTWFRHQLPEFEWVTPEEARGWLERRCSIRHAQASGLNFCLRQWLTPAMSSAMTRWQRP